MKKMRAMQFLGKLFAGAMILFLSQLMLVPQAAAQHTSAECPPQTATVTAGGTVTLDITDCTSLIGFVGSGAVDGGSYPVGGPYNFPDHGSANGYRGGPSNSRWFMTYSHNGTTGIGSTDVFETTDGQGDGDVLITITILPSSSPLSVTPGSLPSLTAGTPFSQTLSTSGGQSPYTYTLQSGSLPVGLNMNSGGVISGTPTQRGPYSFSVRATDSTSPTAQFIDKGYTGNVQIPTLTLSPSSFSVTQSTPVSFGLSATGGVPPYTYLVEPTPGNAMPPGLSISSAGVVSGTPTSVGTFTTTLRVGESSTGTGTVFELETLTITVLSAPTVSISVAPASVNEDGVTNLVYTVSRSVATPSAVTVNLNTSGSATSGSDYSGAASTITIPANATSATLTIDPAADVTVEANETVIISVAAGSGYSIGSPSSATGTITNDEGTSFYCPTLLATVAWGGTVSLNAGGCNAGFGLGVVLTQPTHGTATVGTFGVNQPIIYSHNGTSGTTDTFTVNDGEAPPGNQIRVNVTITPPTSSIVVNPATLPTVNSGAAFSQTLSATGGTGPYSWSLVGGALPTGLTLSGGGVISGTPTQRGSFNFTVRARDSLNAFSDKGYSGTVGVQPLSITPASATAVQNQPVSINIAGSGGVAPYSFLHEVVGGALPPGMTLSSAGVLSGTPTTIGTTNFQIRVTDSSTGPGSYFELENFSFTVTAAPSVSIAVSPASISEDGATNATFTVTRSLNLASPTTVNVTASGTATAGSDYTGAVATVTIPAGATTATFTIDPAVDGTIEPDETVTFIVAAGTGYTVGVPASATGTILNDDIPSATIAVSPAAVAEDGAPNLIYTVTLNQAAFGAISLNYAIGGTATNGTDYATIASPLVIPAGNTTGTITVNPTADAVIEADETVTLTLAAGTGYTVGVPNAVTGTILNDDLPNLTINDVTVNEGNSGTTNATFTVSLSAPAGPGGVTFNIATANGSATSGTDYVARSLTAQTIPAGSSSYTFTIQLNGELLNEPSETFFVNVTSVLNAVVVDGQGVGTITNDDPLPSLSINDVTVVEGNGGTVNAVFTVALNAASGQTVAVNYATADGTATQPADYAATSGTLTFTAGQTSRTITVPVIGEAVPEANESFFVNLSGATNATISDNQGLGTITNDDVPVTLSPATLTGGTVGVAYNSSITASSGTAPYSFAVTGGSLPSGLTLSSGGLLSGVPTAGGSFGFTVTATDASGAPGPFSGTQSYTLAIGAPSLELPATSLSGGTLGQAYSASLAAATGGTAPYAYSVTGGVLPGGLVLNSSTGAITGTPGALGTFNFTVTATDSSTGAGPYSVQQSYALTVIDQPPVATGTSLSLAYNAPATNVPLSLSGGAAVSLAIATAPLHGTATVSGTTISYQPTTGYAGADSFTYSATNSGGTSAPATVTVSVQDPVVVVTPSGGFNATVAAAYTQTFTFNGGAAPWSGYQVTNLPTGLAVTGTGANTVTIGGTPTQAGSFALAVSATDSSSGTGPFLISRPFTLNVAAPTLSMSPAPGTLSAPYAAPFSQSFAASGGTGSFSYALTGTLPSGMTFTGSTLAGTPIAPGSYPITVTATDTNATGVGAPFSVANNYTLVIAAPSITVTPTALPNATAGQPYTQALGASGAVGPYSYGVNGGALPAGVTLSAAGQLSGVPIASGSFAFTVLVRDANGQTGTASLTLAVNVPTLIVTPATLPNASQGIAYAQSLTVNGGVAPYSFAVSSGALPVGLTLNSATGAIGGTPTGSGTANFAITVTDSTGGTRATATINYTLAVSARPNPANDVEVKGLVRAQVDAARRFAEAQVDNFMARMESMHGGGSGDGAGIAFHNSVRITTLDYCRDALTMMTNSACTNLARATGLVALNGWKSDEAADGPKGSAAANGQANAGSGGGGIGGPLTFWAGGAVRFGERDTNSGRIRQEFESEGITIGADYRFGPAFAAGLGVGLGRDTVDVGDNGSQSRGEAKTVALYGSLLPASGWFVDMLVGYQTLEFDLRRYVTPTGAMVNSKRDGDQWFASVSAGTDIQSGNWQITPYARIDVTRATLQGYAERSGSMFDLTFLDQNVNFTSLGLGSRVQYSHKTPWGHLLPQLRAEYQWNVERNADARVTYNDLIANPFSTIPLIGIGREELTLGAKLEAMIGSDLGLALEYLGRFSKGSGSDGTVQVGLKYAF